MAAKAKDRKIQPSFEDSGSREAFSLDQTYCPQSEEIQELHYLREASKKTITSSDHSFC